MGVSYGIDAALEQGDILSDQGWLFMILINLLGNAFKYARSGVVTVTATEASGRLRLSVADQGGGVEPHLEPHLFTPYAQA